MSEFVKISENGSKVESGQGGISNFNGKDGVVPFNPDTVRQGSSDRFEISSDGDYKHDNAKVTRVTSDGHVPAGGLDFQDQYGRQVSDPRKVKESDSIRVGNTRCSVKVALDMGLIAVDGQGNYSIVEQKAPEAVKQEAQEPIAYKADLETLAQFDARVPRSMTDSYLTQVLGAMISGKPAGEVVDAFAQNSGCTHETLVKWTESYANNLMESGLTMAAKASSGQYSTDEIFDYVDSCSNGYKQSLLLSLHHGNRGAMAELLSNMRQNKRP